jgi:hypothetical protein
MRVAKIQLPRELIAKFHTDGVRSNQGASSSDASGLEWSVGIVLFEIVSERG